MIFEVIMIRLAYGAAAAKATVLALTETCYHLFEANLTNGPALLRDLAKASFTVLAKSGQEDPMATMEGLEKSMINLGAIEGAAVVVCDQGLRIGEPLSSDRLERLAVHGRSGAFSGLDSPGSRLESPLEGGRPASPLGDLEGGAPRDKTGVYLFPEGVGRLIDVSRTISSVRQEARPVSAPSSSGRRDEAISGRRPNKTNRRLWAKKTD